MEENSSSPVSITSATPECPSYSKSLSKNSLTFHVMTSVSSPMQKAIVHVITLQELMQEEDEKDARSTNPNPEEWLPITESRNGNAFYAAFHTLSSGIGFQALLLPLAFTLLGWIWGLTWLSLGFIWQLYTLWLLTQLHESDSGTRYSRYLRLSIAAFGEKQGKLLCLFPIMYLSGGSCVGLIMFAGGALKILFNTLCGSHCSTGPLTTEQWYVVFTCCAVLLSQLLPNLNSVAGVSLIGAVTAVLYCTLVWVVPLHGARPEGLSYEPVPVRSEAVRVCTIVNAIGMIALAFRGHNLILEIQGTMPTSNKQPSRIPMWRGVKFAYLIIGVCLFSLAIGGYWAYGNLITTKEGILNALYKYHGHDVPNFLLAFVSLLVVINCLSSFQIYAMPVFDNLEFRYTSRKNKPCPIWLRRGIRVFFGGLTVLISVAFPFLPSLAGLIGGISLPITLAYPCFMWIIMKKPQKCSFMWCLNWGLGCLGILLSILLVAGSIWSIVVMGMEVHFFKLD